LIAQGLAPFSPASAGIKAGRLLLEQIFTYIDKRTDFAIESTLASKTYIPLIRKIKQKGYSIHKFFLWIPSMGLAKMRIVQRVQEGGHDVLGKDVVRRFSRSIENFFKFYESLCDSWVIFDNSTERPVLIANKKEDSLVVHNQKLFNNIKKGY
jgi:predicted ABC-type ATPase